MSGYTYNAQPIRLARTGTPGLWGSVDLAPFRRFIRLGTTGADTELREIVQFAGPWVEGKCSTTLAEDTLELEVDTDKLCSTDVDGNTYIELPFGPVSGVTSVAWDGGSETSLTLDTKSKPERVMKPTTVPADATTLTVTYTAGHSAWSDLSGQEQFAVMVAVSHFWQNREAVSNPAMASVPFMMAYALSAIDRRPLG